MAPSVLDPAANSGTVVLVSGGGTGIGRATALEMSRTGAQVVVCGRRIEPLEDTRREIAGLGHECLAVGADLREPEEVARVVDVALERFGALDAVVNNAGGQFTAAAEDISVVGLAGGAPARGRGGVEPHEPGRSALYDPPAARRHRVHRFQPSSWDTGHGARLRSARAVENLAGGLACEWSKYGIRGTILNPVTEITRDAPLREAE